MATTDREKPTGMIPGRPGEEIEETASPWIVAVAVPLGALLGLGLRLLEALLLWLGWVSLT